MSSGDDDSDVEDHGDDDENGNDKRAGKLTPEQQLIFIKHLSQYYGTQKFKSTAAMCAHILGEIRVDEVRYIYIVFLSVHQCMLYCHQHFQHR